MATDPICGMMVDEKTGLSLEKDGHFFYFCSEHCLKKFAGQHNIPQTACSVHSGKAIYKNKTFIIAGILAALISISYIIPFLEPFRVSFLMYLKTIWWAVILGLLLGGIIDHYIPREYISLVLTKPKKITILYSVLLGFLMSACSHGILALSIELHKKGASNPAVIAFLLASPWANMALTVMLIGFFGINAFFIIISAIIIAIITGLVFQLLARKGLIETNPHSMVVRDDFSIVKDVKRRFHAYRFSAVGVKKDVQGVYEGMISLGNMVVWWILIGIGIASIAGAYIPTAVFKTYMGPTVLGLIVTLVLATVIEVCSEGSAPLAFEIFRQTGALGNSFVFLMAGVVTDYTEIGLIWHNIGRKTAIWLPIIAVPQVIILGIIANIFF